MNTNTADETYLTEALQRDSLSPSRQSVQKILPLKSDSERESAKHHTFCLHAEGSINHRARYAKAAGLAQSVDLSRRLLGRSFELRQSRFTNPYENVQPSQSFILNSS